MSSAKNYAPFVEFCVLKLVENQKEVDVTEVREGNAVQVRVRVAPDDAGKVIGRSGRIVSSIRQILGTSAEKSGDRAYVKVITE